MFSYIWPIALVVLSNTLYQICAKAVPEGMNPLASLTVTYLVGAVVSCAMYFIPKTSWTNLRILYIMIRLRNGYVSKTAKRKRANR